VSVGSRSPQSDVKILSWTAVLLIMSSHNLSREALIGSAMLGSIFIAGYYVGKENLELN